MSLKPPPTECLLQNVKDSGELYDKFCDKFRDKFRANLINESLLKQKKDSREDRLINDNEASVWHELHQHDRTDLVPGSGEVLLELRYDK